MSFAVRSNARLTSTMSDLNSIACHATEKLNCDNA